MSFSFRKSCRLTILILLISIVIAFFLNLTISYHVKVDKYLEPRTVSGVSGYYYYTNRSPTELKNLCEEKGLRLMDIEVRSSSPLKFDFVLGPLGGFSSNRCWHLYGYNKTYIDNYLTENNARVLDLEVYGAQMNKLAVILASKEKKSSKYQFDYNIKPRELRRKINNINIRDNARVIDIEHYYDGTKRRYAFVTIPNDGLNHRDWEFLGNKNFSEIQNFYRDNNYNLIDLEPQENGKFSAVFVEDFGTARWSVRKDLKYEQIAPTVKSRDMRIIDLERYKNSSGKTRYSLVMVNNIKDREHENHEKVVNIIDQYLKDSGAVGVTVSIVKDGEIIYSAGRGYSNYAKNYWMSPYVTTQRWASISKSTLGVVAAKLHRQGVIDIHEPIDTYWSEYERPIYDDIIYDGKYYDLNDDNELVIRLLREQELHAVSLFPSGPSMSYERITPPARVPSIAMLASHTAGIQHYKNGPNVMTPPVTWRNNIVVNNGMEWAVKYWRKDGDSHSENFRLTQPQGYYSYSSFGPNLGCVAIEHAWKNYYREIKSFEDIFMQLVGTPFGMTFMQADRHRWEPDPYQTKAYLVGREEDPNGDTDVSYKLCGGGWKSTNLEMAKYAKGLLTSRSIFTDEDRALMWTNYIDPDKIFGGTSSYGLGWISPGTNPNHAGKNPGALNRLKLYRSSNNAIVIMSNTEVQNENIDPDEDDYISILRDALIEEFVLN
jgi:CubicO group peptidase (beta-lactamase class C family)